VRVAGSDLMDVAIESGFNTSNAYLCAKYSKMLEGGELKPRKVGVMKTRNTIE